MPSAKLLCSRQCNAMQCNVKPFTLILRTGTWATRLFELLQERNVHVPRCDYALHLKFLSMDHTLFTHIHLTPKMWHGSTDWLQRFDTICIISSWWKLHYTMAIRLHRLVAIQSIAITQYITHSSKCKKKKWLKNQMSSLKMGTHMWYIPFEAKFAALMSEQASSALEWPSLLCWAKCWIGLAQFPFSMISTHRFKPKT